MEALNQWKVARLHLKEAASSFLDACITLRKVAAQSFPSHPNRIVLENVLDDLQSQTDSISVVENCIHESRAVLNALLNVSTSRVPINKLPPEILSRIFSILVGSSPCYPKRGQRDALPDIILVCGRWYQVATNNRSLWSHIDVHAGPLALSRTRLWLERSRGVATHIHTSKAFPRTQQTVLSSLISILQPHATFASSLTISGGDTDLVRALLALHFGHGEPSSLKTLAASGVWEFNQERAISWPTYPLRGLRALELRDLHKFACPALDEVATILSDCPELHTLRFVNLRNFRIRPDQHQIPSVIPLPQLKLLELTLVLGQGLPIFLSMLQPGDLELDVRLKIQLIGEGEVPLHLQSLLARSNVVSWAIPDVRAESSAEIHSLFSCVPHLRVFHLHLRDYTVNVLPRLGAPADDGTVPLLPNLESLCLSEGNIRQVVMNRVKEVVTARRLRNLVFLSCKFPAAYNEHPDNVEYHGEAAVGNEDEGEDGDGDGDAINVPWEPDEYFKGMPESIKGWLSERVENLVVCETPVACI
ncbi:hypothetical protein FRC10_003913 [Ceratobasidium sp. 414]|nr:hypothetical protein FRC10_003913 [Ceratobasidium sp. 414]